MRGDVSREYVSAVSSAASTGTSYDEVGSSSEESHVASARSYDGIAIGEGKVDSSAEVAY